MTHAAEVPREPDPSPSSVLPQRHRQRLAVYPADDAHRVATGPPSRGLWRIEQVRRFGSRCASACVQAKACTWCNAVARQCQRPAATDPQRAAGACPPRIPRRRQWYREQASRHHAFHHRAAKAPREHRSSDALKHQLPPKGRERKTKSGHLAGGRSFSHRLNRAPSGRCLPAMLPLFVDRCSAA